MISDNSVVMASCRFLLYSSVSSSRNADEFVDAESMEDMRCACSAGVSEAVREADVDQCSFGGDGG